ncbi:MAG: head GIN domain-containing protein [Flavobacteriaceae bacterium]|nr:head GIN domain-containing protein [Flavobacteriaceae bacterium]
MKTFTKISAVIVLFLTTSCMIGGVKGNRIVKTATRSISSDFEAIRVSNGIDVYLTMGNSTSLKLEADENLHDIIQTEVEDGVLKIYADENIWSAKRKKVYLNAEKVNEIRVNSGAELRSENTLETDDLKVSVTSGADVRLIVDVVNLTCSTTSGSDARIEGTADHFVAKSTSGSDLQASGLEAKTCEARVTSGADISVNVTEELDANATSGGDIKYVGNPKKIRKNSSSGGDVRG